MCKIARAMNSNTKNYTIMICKFMRNVLIGFPIVIYLQVINDNLRLYGCITPWLMIIYIKHPLLRRLIHVIHETLVPKYLLQSIMQIEIEIEKSKKVGDPHSMDSSRISKKKIFGDDNDVNKLIIG